jgi:hypothetical protein
VTGCETRRHEGGGFAAAHYPDGPWPGDAPREGYGAAPPASRLLRIALRATALRANGLALRRDVVM